MRIRGTLKRSGAVWAVEIPCLGIFTQGRSHADGLRMVADALEALADRRGFRVDVRPEGRYAFTVGSDRADIWTPLVLRRLRMAAGLSLSEVTQRLGAKSRNAYARYEQGLAEPTLAKLEQLLRVVAPKAELVVTEAA